MFRTRHVLSALFIAATATAAAAASGVVVSKSADIKGKKVEDIIAKYGAFCAIEKWHPAVAKCDESKEGNDVFRTLTLKDGAKIKEKRTSQSEGTYGYKITESPLPVKDYMATFSIKKSGDSDVSIGWVASFQAKDKPEAEAKKVIEGIFDAGLKSISEMAAK